MQDDSTVTLLLVNIALVLGLCNAPLWLGAIATGVFRHLRNREHDRLRTELRMYQANMAVIRADANDRVRMAEMETGQRAKVEDAKRIMLGLLNVQATEGSMSLADATKARPRMSREDWKRARNLLSLAGVVEFDGNGEARLIVSPFDARARVTVYLAGLKDAPNYVFP